jgi:hypothetical protein
MVKTYYLNQLIYELAYSSYAITFMEVLVQEIRDIQTGRLGRGIIEVNEDILIAFENEVKNFKLLLGTNDATKKTEAENARQIKEAKRKWRITRTGSEVFNAKKYKEEIKKINDKYDEKIKQLKVENYGVMPVSISYNGYEKLLTFLRNNQSKLFDIGFYDITKSIQQKFFYDSGKERLSTVISPDWVIQIDVDEKSLLNDKGINSESKWRYRLDENLQLPANIIPYKNYRCGFKLCIFTKTEVLDYIFNNKANIPEYYAKTIKDVLKEAKKEEKNLVNYTKLEIGLYIEKLFEVGSSSKEYIALLVDFRCQGELKNIPIDQFLNGMDNPDVNSNTKVVWLSNSLNFEKFIQNIGSNINPNKVSYYPTLEAGNEKDTLKTNYNRIYGINQENGIKYIPSRYQKEYLTSVKEDIKDFTSDYTKFKVKDIAEKINVIIPEDKIKIPSDEPNPPRKQASQDVHESVRFAKEMVDVELDLLEGGIKDENIIGEINIFKELMSEDKFV